MFRSSGVRVRPLASVSTLLAPGERARVDAAGEGVYQTRHRESWEELARDLREQRADAVLVSVAYGGQRDAARMARMVREFPRVPAVALLTQLDAATPHAVLAFGAGGVRQLVDVRLPAGWRELRDVLARERAGDLETRAVRMVAADLAGAPPDCVRFFELCFRGAARLATVRAVARELGVLPSTFMSRFCRAGLPAPKRYLALARLTRAAWLFENPGLSVAAIANALEYSSPQSFGRHVRALTGLTAGTFRQRYDGEGMLERFRAEMVLPYRERLLTFSPLRMPLA